MVVARIQQYFPAQFYYVLAQYNNGNYSDNNNKKNKNRVWKQSQNKENVPVNLLLEVLTNSDFIKNLPLL